MFYFHVLATSSAIYPLDSRSLRDGEGNGVEMNRVLIFCLRSRCYVSVLSRRMVRKILDVESLSADENTPGVCGHRGLHLLLVLGVLG